jgi:16S rRNA (guanine527-N7)-methyltransferase
LHHYFSINITDQKDSTEFCASSPLFFYASKRIVMTEMTTNNQEDKAQIDEFKEMLEKALQDFQIAALNEEQMKQLVGHYAMMIEWNRHTNLTRITEPAEAARFHYAESIFGARFAGAAQKILDIGSGAGFPALPLAVANPDTQVTALESNQKKTFFLSEVKEALQIANFKIARARVEDFTIQSYDLLTSRALDRTEDVIPKVLKKMRIGQRLMLYCALGMVERLQKKLTASYNIQTHQIPMAESRIIAIFARQ